MKKLLSSVLMFIVFFNVANAAMANGDADDYFLDSFPTPSGNPKQLFYLQRTPNTNTVIYETNFNSEGKLDPDDPIHVYWIRYPEGGGIKELNYIQKHFAYGVKSEPIEDGRYRLTFAAYKKRNFYLIYAPRDNKYHIYGTVGNKVVMLERVFIQINPGGTFWAPNVQYIDIRGREVSSGKEVTERIIIAKK
jgi:hypothetical protein